mmetsp:Transcript_15454/g.54126  ORF Transcript_15454/g.54126 Transcript_15454/m.54126 type:complete len:278 (+) Transcript_15454:165-998(+)
MGSPSTIWARDGFWAFGNDGVSNAEFPLSCGNGESKDVPYLRTIIKSFIPSTSRIYITGFSQNSMFAYNAAACFPDKVVGVNQGGSGLAVKGVPPTSPDKQSECNSSCFAKYGQHCAKVAPCADCIGPSLKSCLFTYTNDSLYGSDKNMWDLATANGGYGNDVRRTIFEPDPSNGIEGGHAESEDAVACTISCLEINAPCTAACKTGPSKCIKSGGASSVGKCLAETAVCIDASGSACAPSKEALSLVQGPTISVFGKAWDGSRAEPQPKSGEEKKN